MFCVLCMSCRSCCAFVRSVCVLSLLCVCCVNHVLDVSLYGVVLLLFVFRSLAFDLFACFCVSCLCYVLLLRSCLFVSIVGLMCFGCPPACSLPFVVFGLCCLCVPVVRVIVGVCVYCVFVCVCPCRSGVRFSFFCLTKIVCVVALSFLLCVIAFCVCFAFACVCALCLSCA